MLFTCFEFKLMQFEIVFECIFGSHKKNSTGALGKFMYVHTKDECKTTK